MGISGLLPLLKSIQKPCNLQKFAGQTIGVDAYGWLHRGTVACSIDLALGNPTTKWVDFSMNRVRMLIHFGVIPYLVFDGDYLPSKAATEDARAKRREESKKLGLELHKLGKISQAHLELQKAVDVTPEMARQLIEELKRIKVQYVVAPYEADAQLAYLERKGIIQGIISEDSDLLVFGAKRLLTKLDQYGDCVEINRDDFTACQEVSLIGWSDAEFRRMAILSGCDYLASINKMGLKTAYRLVRKHKTIERILRMLQFDGQFHIPIGYLEAFRKAELTFLHQRVFCPEANALIMVTKFESGVEPEDFAFVGKDLERDIAIGVAVGDLHPMTKQPIVFEGKRKGTPKTPWTIPRSQSIDVASAIKGKSLDSFFKPKRTPLAELDPNVFTPSPSQQRLLEQHNGTWSSSPAPARPFLSRSTTVQPRSISTPLISISNQAVSHRSVPVSSSNPAKRQRLCSELESLTSASQQTAKVETAKSRFFASSALEPSPSMPRTRKSGIKKAADITIWSDDIEDVMANLPDIVEGEGAKKIKKLAVFIDDMTNPVMETGTLERSNDEVNSIMNAQRTNWTTCSDQSVISSAKFTTSVSNSSQRISATLNKHVTAELAALGKGTRPVSTGRIQAPLPVTQTSSVRQKSTTPLQRLKVSALNRAQSRNGMPDQAGGESEKPISRAISESRSAKQNSGKAANVDQTEPPTLAVQGSEDLLVPCSEDEGDDIRSHTEELSPSRVKLDLGRFAFAG